MAVGSLVVFAIDNVSVTGEDLALELLHVRVPELGGFTVEGARAVTCQ